MTDPILVGIVDDHPLMREGLANVLESAEGIAVACRAENGAQALDVLGSAQVDVVLLDYRLPDSDGISVLRELRQSGCEARVIMLTCFGSDRCVRAAVQSGACGFLTKRSASPKKIIDAVRRAHDGATIVSPDALDMLFSGVRDEYPHDLAHVSDREIEVWRLLASGETNAEIAAHLGISERTVKSHVGNLYQKTGTSSRAEATALAYRSGLMDDVS